MESKADLERAVSLVEALLFASAAPVRATAITEMLSSQGFVHYAETPSIVLDALNRRYDGHAVELYAVSKGWQFRTRQEFGEALSCVIERPRKLSKGALESLSVIAYHQPCTRVEVETIRGVRLGQNIVDTLLEEGLIAPKGRKEVPGRPVLWGTTAMFLRLFGLKNLQDLPRRDELLFEPPSDEEEGELQEVLKPS